MSLITKRIITDLPGSPPYLLRWSLWLPFGWSIKLHQILRADDDRCLHSHPWPMLRVIVWGGYAEEHGAEHCVSDRKPWRPWAFWRVYPSGRGFRHRITRLFKKSSWTVVLCGPTSGNWGFFTKYGYMPWRKFLSEAGHKRVLWCDDGRSLNVAADERISASDAIANMTENLHVVDTRVSVEQAALALQQMPRVGYRVQDMISS